MADPFVAEIRVVPFNFAPKGWAWCDGQLLPLSQNTALFSLLGTTYGGNGKSNFALPNIQGSCVVGAGQGSGGLTERFEGEVGGTSSVTLIQSEMPAHSHTLRADNGIAALGAPANDVVMARSVGGQAYSTSTASPTNLAPQALTPAGGNLPHNNMQPYLTLSYIIALQGVFPPRP